MTTIYHHRHLLKQKSWHLERLEHQDERIKQHGGQKRQKFSQRSDFFFKKLGFDQSVSKGISRQLNRVMLGKRVNNPTIQCIILKG